MSDGLHCHYCGKGECECPCNHEWVTQRRGGSPVEYDSDERVTYCRQCGIEKPAD